jgi:hypothetical protein
MIKVTENSIIIDRKALFDWVTGEVSRSPEPVSEPEVPPAPTNEPETSVDVGKGVDLFETKNGIGGVLQDADGGSKKLQEMKKWMSDNKFSYRNFCLYLSKITEIAGWNLSKPLIGTTQKGEPSLFQVATRYYSYWKSQQPAVAKEYKSFLRDQVQELGFTIEQAAEVLDGEIIDPAELPKGTEVSV